MNNALRDRIAASIREADSHNCMYGEGIDAGYLADAVMEVLGGERGVTCDTTAVATANLERFRAYPRANVQPPEDRFGRAVLFHAVRDLRWGYGPTGQEPTP